MAEVFLDTNILLRHFLQDVPGQSDRASSFMLDLEHGKTSAMITDTVVFEVVFNLQRLKKRRKAEIRDGVLALLDLPSIEYSGKARLHRTFQLYVELNLPFADAHHVAMMEQAGLTEIVSFDRDFDRVPGVTRVEPA